MTLWQYNAWSEAYQARMRDQLAIQLQAAHMNAYWNSAAKHKKSLQSVLKGLQDKPKAQRKPISYKEVAERFRQFEELQKYGRTEINNN